MEAHQSADGQFYLPADAFFRANLPTALTFDDVSLSTLYSDILPRDADTSTSLSDTLRLPVPILSADMDTVTESRMAIAMALNGGMGLIHYNMAPRDQVKEVARVKRHIHGLIQDPITVSPGQTIGEVLAMIDARRFAFSTFPVVDEHGRLAGLLSGNVVKERYKSKHVSDVMTAARAAHHRDRSRRRRRPDPRRRRLFQPAHRHQQDAGRRRAGPPPRPGHRLRRGAHHGREKSAAGSPRATANSASSSARPSPRSGARTASLDRDAHPRPHRRARRREDRRDRGLHGPRAHPRGRRGGEADPRGVFPTSPSSPATSPAPPASTTSAECGANAIKIGQGPGSICTTRIVAGVGIPQLTALYVSSHRRGRRDRSA